LERQAVPGRLGDVVVRATMKGDTVADCAGGAGVPALAG
jgi:hypothetical protein